MKNTLKLILTSIAIIISACDSRSTLETNNIDFSIGGVKLGIFKDELEKKHTLSGCKPLDSTTATCFIDDDKVVYKIFGTTTNFISIKLAKPYTTIVGISMTTNGPMISKSSIEEHWNLKGRCLSKREIDQAVEFDVEGSGYFRKSLSEFNLLPHDNNSFICLAKNKEFIKYSYYPDKKEAGVDIYYLKDVFANNYEYIFQSKAKYDEAIRQTELIANPVSGKNGLVKIRCEDLSYENKNMQKI